MKTHIDIDEELLTKAIKLGRHRSKRAGKIRWEGDLDQMRGRSREAVS